MKPDKKHLLLGALALCLSWQPLEAAVYIDSIKASDPIALYEFQDFGTGVLKNSISSSHNGTYTGTGILFGQEVPSFPGASNPSVYFPRTSATATNYASVDIASLTNASFSVEFLFENQFTVDADQPTYFFAKGSSSTPTFFLGIRLNTEDALRPYQELIVGRYLETVYTGYEMALNDWMQVAMTFDATDRQMRLYIDGAEVSSTIFAGNSSGPTFTLGRRLGNHPAQGLFSDFSIYNKVLSSSDIQGHYQALSIPEGNSIALTGIGMLAFLLVSVLRRRSSLKANATPLS